MVVQIDCFRQELCEYCQRFDLLDMINDAIVLVDASQGDVLFMNQKSLAMYGYSQTEQPAISIKDISYDSYETVRGQIDAVIKQKTKGYIFTANHVKKNGTIFQVEVSARFLTFHGTHIVAALVRDLAVEGKMRREMDIAGKIQRRRLPRNMETALFRMTSVYQPLDTLSGDLYDILYYEDSQILFGIMIDVMGHGIVASSQGGILQYLFRQAVEKPIAINDKLAWMNNEVVPFFNSDGFAAALIFELDFRCNTLTYASAGLNYFLQLNKTGVSVIKNPGLFLGIHENETYGQGILPFESGDSFFFLTDGLFEIMPQPISASHTYWSMHELCKELAVSKAATDDASCMGILVR